MLNSTDTCQKADQQASNGGDENGKGTVPHVGHLIDRQVPGPTTPTKQATYLRKEQLSIKGAITSKIKHAINIKQVLQDLHNCCTTVAAFISILF